MGRQAAGEAFLRAWVRHSGADQALCWAEQPDHAKEFERRVHAIDPALPTDWSRADRTGPLAAAGALWLAGPQIGPPAWLRRRGPQNRWSVVGITHTTASHLAMDAIADLLIAPLQPWDALICTSKAVAATVAQVLDMQREYLAARLGAHRFELPALPIIPLGVHTGDFQHRPEARAQWRAQLGIAVQDIAVLQMGRLSFHAKAHPIPLFLALESAARTAGIRPHLIMAGWFANEGQERFFRDGAAQFAPSVTLHHVDGRDPAVRYDIWSAADIFTLLADNVQETFGLAPVEAMAAGLPVVVSDWDGFKDTIDHGVTGFRVPTYQPPPPAGDYLAARYEAGMDNYDRYVGSAAQSVAVDVRQAAAAFSALFQDVGLRQAMGARAKDHVERFLSWRVVIGHYRELLVELERRRGHADTIRAPLAAGSSSRAARADPFLLFKNYPTAPLGPATMLSLGDTDMTMDMLSAWGPPLLQAGLPDSATLESVRRRLATAPLSIAQLTAGTAGPDQARLLRGIGWLAKMGCVNIGD